MKCKQRCSLIYSLTVTGLVLLAVALIAALLAVGLVGFAYLVAVWFFAELARASLTFKECLNKCDQ
jgi:hypothetical protein